MGSLLENDRPAATCPGFNVVREWNARSINSSHARWHRLILPRDPSSISLGIKPRSINSKCFFLFLELWEKEKKKRFVLAIRHSSRGELLPAFPRSSANFRPKPARKFRAESKRKSPGFSSRPRQLTSLHLLVCPLVFPSRLISSLLPIVGTSRIKREQVPRYYTLWKIPRYYIEFRLDHRKKLEVFYATRAKRKGKNTSSLHTPGHLVSRIPQEIDRGKGVYRRDRRGTTLFFLLPLPFFVYRHGKIVKLGLPAITMTIVTLPAIYTCVRNATRTYAYAWARATLFNDSTHSKDSECRSE